MPIITEEQAYERLRQVMDPELNIDLVSLGLIYEVTVKEVQAEDGLRTHVHILMTLTTPGCPLAHVFDTIIKDAFYGLEGFEPDRDVTTELTFDPPWFQDMMSEEAKAELGF